MQRQTPKHWPMRRIAIFPCTQSEAATSKMENSSSMVTNSGLNYSNLDCHSKSFTQSAMPNMNITLIDQLPNPAVDLATFGRWTPRYKSPRSVHYLQC
ncbi:MAG: hypothetical protein H6R14_2323 [Proteobacteria bacterium]|nr:hypothetical protein [Pseudomonadota bacterium]